MDRALRLVWSEMNTMKARRQHNPANLLGSAWAQVPGHSHFVNIGVLV
jgi:hypothetical protein